MLPPITLTSELQAQMEETARQDGKTLAQVMEEAAERYLNHRGLDRLLERGREYAVKKGIKPSDVSRAIADVRQGR